MTSPSYGIYHAQIHRGCGSIYWGPVRESEAPIWGHGIVEPGPKAVEGMPIGSHHSWYGLLFVKGVVGVIALAVPMLLTAIYLLFATQFSVMARIGICLMAVFVCYSFFENLEILSYLYWPAFLWFGMAMNRYKLGLLNQRQKGV